MGPTPFRLAGTGLLYLFIVLSGKWLSRCVRPLKPGVLTIHTLVSLATLAYLVVIIVRLSRARLPEAGDLVAALLTGLAFVATIASGGVLSARASAPLRLHQAASLLSVLPTAATLYCMV